VVDPSAIYDVTFTTGALVSGSDTLAGFSSRGPVTFGPVAEFDTQRVKPDIVAPGTSVCSSIPGGGYSSGFSGTSMSGPHVSGAVALLISSDPSLAGNVDALEQRLAESAFPLSTTSCSSQAGVFPNNLFGHGRLDALCAVTPGCGAPLPDEAPRAAASPRKR
jgi:bacillopeptidase F